MKNQYIIKKAKKIFLTGIGTEVGKTVVSAILVEKFTMDYWKPVQAGELDFTDTMKVRSWVKNDASVFHQEQFRLKTPASPHFAAKVDGIQIKLEDFEVPETENNLLVEGAGGLMVPINDKGDLIIDLIPKVADGVILVSRNYLGSINHTMLSIEALQKRKIPILGLIFNGDSNPATEEIILNKHKLKCLGKVPLLSHIDTLKIREAGSFIEAIFA
ncbi:MAG: dethiobiotin synthase [Crocinitomicaceae bacterium]|nr:dethiobiotin synthase [Crocinitomicaceae bacterium]